MDKTFSYNIIGEVQLDGQGDWAYTKTIANFLINRGIPLENITIYFLVNIKLNNNIEFFSDFVDKTTCSRNLSNLALLDKNSYIISGSNINKQLKTDLLDLDNDIKFQNPIQPNNLTHTQELIDFYKSGIKNYNYTGNSYLCTNSRYKFDDDRVKSLLDMDNYHYNDGFMLFALKNNFIPNVKTYLIPDDSNNKLDKNQLSNEFIQKIEDPKSINIIFETNGSFINYKGENFNKNYNIKLDKNDVITIKEGGFCYYDNELCVDSNNGFIQAEPIGDDLIVNQFIQNIKLDHDLDKECRIHVAYINPENDLETLINFTTEIFNNIGSIESNKSCICFVGKNFDDLIEYYQKLSPYEKVSETNNKIIIKKKNKIYHIITIGSISLYKNNFNFAKLLEKTDDYCILTGDQSYMEGLTLNKRVIYDGSLHKLNFVNQILNDINNELNVFDKPINHKIYLVSSDDIKSLAESLAKLLSHPNYKLVLSNITRKNFFDTIQDKIIQLINKNKYIKYKTKYLKLKKHNQTKLN